MSNLLQYWYVLIVLVVLVVFPKNAHASEVSLGVYPPIFQINAMPPITLKSPLTIHNNGTDPVTLEIQIRPFTNSEGNNGQITLLPQNQRITGADPNILQRIQILDGNKNIDQIILGPQEQKDLTFVVDVPKQEPPSDYYFSIIFISKDKVIDQKNASVMTAGIATNVLLSVGPKETTTGFLSQFSVPFLLTQGPVPFTVSVYNTSNHFISPQGNIVMKNMFGQTIGTVPLLPVNILSHTQRFIPDTSFSSQTEAIWSEKVLFGPYSSQITIALSPHGPLFKKTIYFVVLPWQFLVGFVFICIVIALIIIRVRQMVKNR